VLGAVWTIVVAAGTGTRFGGAKQFADLGGRRVVDWSMDLASAISAGVVLVVPADLPVPAGAVVGGATRAASVRRGLAAVPAAAEIVVVHDAARPFAPRSLFDAVVDAVRHGADGAVPGLPVSDTIKQVDDAGVVVATPARSSLVAVQTPQAFRAAMLRQAHVGEPEGTDDASLVEAIGGRVVIVAGDPANRKLTVPDDLDWARERVTLERR
jgi:2-C-methyl-D-erythritol 4-phosphate cytidylyltransferase